MQDENQIHRLDFVGAGLRSVQHVHEVAGKPQFRTRFNRLLAVAQPSNGRRECCHGRRQTNGLLKQPGFAHVFRIRIIDAGHRNRRSQRSHRQDVAWQRLQEFVHRFRKSALFCEGCGKVFELARGRQFTLEQQIGHFLECAVFSQVVDIVAAI